MASAQQKFSMWVMACLPTRSGQIYPTQFYSSLEQADCSARFSECPILLTIAKPCTQRRCRDEATVEAMGRL